MKINVWDRLLAFLYVLITLVLTVFVGLSAFGVESINRFLSNIVASTQYWYLIVVGLMLIVVLLAAHVLSMLFSRKHKKAKFVTVDLGDNGKVIIAMEALEQMVQQSVVNAQGVRDMKIAVHGEEDSISVAVELTVLGGVHLPTVTMKLQRNIRNYIEVNCGVAVRDVAVTVGAVLPPEQLDMTDEPAQVKTTEQSYVDAPVAEYAPEPEIQTDATFDLPAQEEEAEIENFAIEDDTVVEPEMVELEYAAMGEAEQRAEEIAADIASSDDEQL